jgi:hypothetical protein
MAGIFIYSRKISHSERWGSVVRVEMPNSYLIPTYVLVPKWRGNSKNWITGFSPRRIWINKLFEAFIASGTQREVWLKCWLGSSWKSRSTRYATNGNSNQEIYCQWDDTLGTEDFQAQHQSSILCMMFDFTVGWHNSFNSHSIAVSTNSDHHFLGRF